MAHENRETDGKGYHMKKKILALFLTVITVFWVGACGNTSEKNDVGQGPKEAEGG